MGEIVNVVPHNYLEFLDRGRYFALHTVLRDIPVASPVTLVIFAPASTRITTYMHWAFSTADAIHVEFLQNPSLSFEGVGMTLVNQHLPSSNAPESRVHVAATIVDDGTLLAEHQFVSGAGIQAWETMPLYILEPDGVYLLRFTSAAEPNALNCVLGFGEKY